MANDHDLLIQLNTKVGLLCKQITVDNGDMKDSLEHIYNRLDGQDKTFVTWKLFKWIVTFVVAGILAISSISYSNSLSIKDNANQIIIHHPKEER